jgi:hypothetical protein
VHQDPQKNIAQIADLGEFCEKDRLAVKGCQQQRECLLHKRLFAFRRFKATNQSQAILDVIGLIGKWLLETFLKIKILRPYYLNEWYQ